MATLTIWCAEARRGAVLAALADHVTHNSITPKVLDGNAAVELVVEADELSCSIGGSMEDVAATADASLVWSALEVDADEAGSWVEPCSGYATENTYAFGWGWHIQRIGGEFFLTAPILATTALSTKGIASPDDWALNPAPEDDRALMTRALLQIGAI